MTRYFTQYWLNSTWDQMRSGNQQGDHLDHTAGNHFRDRGVTAEDKVYVVTIRAGSLYLLARGTVDRVTDRQAAARHLGIRPEYLGEERDHLLFAADEAARQDYDRTVPLSTVRTLQAMRADGPRPLKFATDKHLDQQALRGVCELTAESARLLDGVIGGRAPIGGSRLPRTAPAPPKAPRAGEVARPRNEREFELVYVEPLIQRLGLTFEYQFRERWKRGSQYFPYKVDYLVGSDGDRLTLFENKLSIRSENAREEPVKQARSYAMELGVPSFVVAAQEGLWLYRVWNSREDLVYPHVHWHEIGQHEAKLKSLMLWLRDAAQHKPPLPPDDEAVTVASAPAAAETAWSSPPEGMPIHVPDAKPYVDAMVLDAVRQAGSIAQDEVVRRVRTQWGLKRAGRRVTEAVNGSVTRLIRRHALHREPGKNRVLAPGSSGG